MMYATLRMDKVRGKPIVARHTTHSTVGVQLSDNDDSSGVLVWMTRDAALRLQASVQEALALLDAADEQS